MVRGFSFFLGGVVSGSGDLVTALLTGLTGVL